MPLEVNSTRMTRRSTISGSKKATFSVRSVGDGVTEATIDASAVPKIPGFIVALLSPILSKGLAKNFGGLLDELAAASERAQAEDLA